MSDKSWNWLPRRKPTTRWTLVQRLHAPAGNTVAAADEFCRCYWYALYSFLRQSGWGAEIARDHVQSFLTSLVERGLLQSADPARGRLWNFLLTLLKRHISGEERQIRAEKRGGKVTHISFEDWQTAEDSWQSGIQPGAAPEDVYRRALAERLVAQAIAVLRSQYAEKTALFETLLPALEGPLPDEGYAAAAERLGMSDTALRTASIRFRERFRRAVCSVAGPSLGMPQGPALEQELREIFAG